MVLELDGWTLDHFITNNDDCSLFQKNTTMATTHPHCPQVRVHDVCGPVDAAPFCLECYRCVWEMWCLTGKIKQARFSYLVKQAVLKNTVICTKPRRNHLLIKCPFCRHLKILNLFIHLVNTFLEYLVYVRSISRKIFTDI